MISPILQDLEDKTEDKGKATDALGARVAAVPGEMGRSMGYSSRPYKTYCEAHRVNCVYNKMSGPTRMARGNEDKGKATGGLSPMVLAVPVVRAAEWVL